MQRRRFLTTLTAVAAVSGCVTINQYSQPTPDDGADQDAASNPDTPGAEVDPSPTPEPRTYDGPTVTPESGGAFELWREIEVAIHNRVNLERDKAGINRLHLAEDMRDVAQAHSRHMIKEDYFAHEGPDGRSWKPTGCDEWGENLYRESGMGQDPSHVAERAVRSWMGSQDHRENIVRESFNSEGVGVAISQSDEIYVTQNLC